MGVLERLCSRYLDGERLVEIDPVVEIKTMILPVRYLISAIHLGRKINVGGYVIDRERNTI